MLFSFVSLCIYAAWVLPTDASVFLGRDLPDLDLKAGNLSEELERVLGDSHKADIEARASELEPKLRPTFLALPQDRDGRLEPAAVRYLLHRFFVDRHGWFVLGFDSEGEAWDSSSPTAVLEPHIGSETQGVFESRLGSRGWSLHEASLIAATLESLVHKEAVQRLHSAYRVLMLSNSEERAEESDVVLALETYMLMYVLGLDHNSTKAEEVNQHWKDIEQVYPTWKETRKWIREVRNEVVSAHPESRNSFSATLQVVEEIGERYGRWQDKECIELKDSLLKLEQRGTGRVPLASFYEAALNGQWQFGENTAYLRQLGNLDETDASRPSVIIPNYVNSITNCVASSKFYAVCCINECEALLSHVEQTVGAPTATPGQIAKIVEQLPSATVDAPRKLPATLLQRLEEIAAHHGGQVPFHGRLFNQFLHHAYPRECPYPHMSGTSKPMHPEKWMQQMGMEMMADEESMRWHIEEARKAGRAGTDEFADELPWSSEEELFIVHAQLAEPEREGQRQTVYRGAAFVAAVCAGTVMLMQLLSTARQAVVASHAKVSV